MIIDLKTEYKTNPLGIGTRRPRLSWKLLSRERNYKQIAYQIRTASSGERLAEGNCDWDSGKILSDQSVHVKYAGPPLSSGEQVFWQVRIWDNKDHEPHWSEIAFWEMGLLSDSDWKASWIGSDIKENTSQSTPCPYLRKEFRLNGAIKSARAYVSSQGLYVLNINGQKAGNELFTPGWTSYKHRIQYQVYDVTELLSSEDNAVGVILGDGWFRGYLVWKGEKNYYGSDLAVILQLRVVYEDGRTEYVVSDNSWRSSTGPILQSDIYNGEAYDARLEKQGWDLAGYDDSGWNKTTTKNYQLDFLVASEGVPVKITETLKPVSKIKTPKGELVFDFGQNMVGWCQVSLKGEAGTKITLEHAEVLDQQGNFYTDNLRRAKASDQYTFKGNGIETYEPHFTFHGFRYVKVSDYEGEISLEDIRGKVIHSDMEPTGDFTCSHDLINRLQKNIQWGMRGNFLDVPTDCPQRDERLGWTGDAQVFAPTACFNMNAAPFFSKWMKDLAVDQKQDGSVPWVVPHVCDDGAGTGWSDGFGSTAWADAALIIPWTVYRYFGDVQILENQFESMKGWVEYMINHVDEDYIYRKGFHFGDWLAFADYYSYNYIAPDYGYAGANTDKDFVATAYFYYSTSILCKTAELLGKMEELNKYKQLLPKIKQSFENEFLSKNGRLSPNTQTAYILALAFDLIPKELQKSAAQRLADDVEYFGHLTTGFVGTPLICKVLSEFGHTATAYKLLFNQRYPSWLFPVAQGATTIWERWDGIRPDGSFQTTGMNSFNHYAYGAIGDWLYSTVAGIRIDESKPGFKHIVIKPSPTKELVYAGAEHLSMYGLIKSHWKYDNDRFILQVTVPPNTTASVFFPTPNKHLLYESGNPIESISDVLLIESTSESITVEIGSGEYEFEIRKT